MLTMTWILFSIFILISVKMVLWGLKVPDRAFQFPTLAGATWLLYIGPQALGVLVNPDLLPPRAVADGGIEMALVMASLCAGASFLGYVGKLNVGHHVRTSSDNFYPGWLFVGGGLLSTIAMLAFYKLASLAGGIAGYYSVAGNYELTWTGLPVAYVFFVKLIYPGILLCLLSTLTRPTFAKWAIVVFLCMLPLANVVFLGRRTEAALLALTIGIAFYFQRGWTPKRWIMISGFVFGFVMVIVAPAYRTYSQLGADYSQILEIDPGNMVLAQVLGKEPTEFHFPVVQLAATQQELEFNYGLGFYNNIIQELVPSLLFGKEFKEQIKIKSTNFHMHMRKNYQWEPIYGWVPTGITDVFRELWFFGAILFFILAKFFRYLWEKSGESYVAKVFYSTFLPWTLLHVIHGITFIGSQFIYYSFFLMPVLMLARIKHK